MDIYYKAIIIGSPREGRFYRVQVSSQDPKSLAEVRLKEAFEAIDQLGDISPALSGYGDNCYYYLL